MFILPNLFTVSSIFCGFYAMVTAAGIDGPSTPADLYRACISVLFAMVFDSVDGRVARLTRTQSDFGVQMDSLADAISFGAAPALIAWYWGLSEWGPAGLFVCFAFATCGVIRLARFNVMAADESGPSSYFVGLPIPAAAGVLVATIITWVQSGRAQLGSGDLWAPVMMVVLGLLMVSTVRFRTFKSTKMSPRVLGVIMLVVTTTVVVAVQVRPSFAIVALMGGYLAAGLAEDVSRRVRRMLVSGDALADDDDEEGEDELEDEGLVPLLSDGVSSRLLDDSHDDDDEEELLD